MGFGEAETFYPASFFVKRWPEHRYRVVAMFTVRGKRKRRSVGTPVTALSPTRVRRGRPMKRSKDLTISKDTVNAYMRELHQAAYPTSTQPEVSSSQLELLPNELLQQIFFLCLEINLPRASLLLARALSKESTYKSLILFAYFDDDEVHPVERTLFLPAAYRVLSIEDKVRLQRDILSCRWCSLDRIKACLPALSKLAMIQSWYEESEALRRLSNCVDITTNGASNQSGHPDSDRWHLPKLEETQQLHRHFFAQADSIDDGSVGVEPGCDALRRETYLPRIVTWHLVLGVLGSLGNLSHGLTKVRIPKTIIAARVLPDWLVSGSPWTQDKLELLRLLRQGFRFLQRDFVLEVSASAVFRGMACAIQEKNAKALMVLLELHNSVFADEMQDIAVLTPQTNHLLPTLLFHLATKAGDQSSMFIWLLARGNIDSVPRDDHVLTGWALRARGDGDEVASWILKYMSGIIDIHIGDHEHLFVHGAVCSTLPDSVAPPAAKHFADELGYLQGGDISLPTNLDGSPCG